MDNNDMIKAAQQAQRLGESQGVQHVVGQPLQPVKWEYCRQVHPSFNRAFTSVNNHPNYLGEKGWELVTVQMECGELNWVYKRPISS